jgi:hypothetical protein
MEVLDNHKILTMVRIYKVMREEAQRKDQQVDLPFNSTNKKTKLEEIIL